MPPSEKPTDHPHWCGGWPMTMRRIRRFISKWQGQPMDQVPFALHAIKYLMAVTEGETTPEEDPNDAPWLDVNDPNDFLEWRPDFTRRTGRMPTPMEFSEHDRQLHNAEEVNPPRKPPPKGVEDPYLGYEEPKPDWADGMW